MIKTIIFFKYTLNQTITSKYLVQKFYNKYFISKLFFNKWKKLLLVNTYSSQILVLSKVYKSLFLMGLLNRGCSLVSDDFIYKNSSLHSYLYSGLNLKFAPTNLVSSFLNRLKFFFNKKETFLLYKIRRGGYLGLIGGLRSFIPSEHLLSLLSPFIVHKNYILFNCVSSTNIFKSYFRNVNFISGGFNFNFNRTKKKRNRLFLGGKLTFMSFSDSLFTNLFVKRFKHFQVKRIKNKFILKLLLKKI